MLNLFRRHGTRCKTQGRTQVNGKNNRDCASDPPCPIFFEGTDGIGDYYKPQLLLDPNGNKVYDSRQAWKIREAMMLPADQRPKPKTTIAEAMESFLKTKNHASEDYQRKFRKLLSEMLEFLEAEPRFRVNLDDILPTDLTDWVSTWTDRATTKTRKRESIRQFFRWCNAKARLTNENPSLAIDSFRSDHVQRDPFTDEELGRIMKALPELPDEYGRKGQPIARQTEAFVLIMRFTGFDVSTTLKLRKAEVDFVNGKIYTHRKKTSKDLQAIPVPRFVLDKLATCPHDSDEYFFWSGEGKIHTRATKWSSRIRRLLDLAGCQTKSPHCFRHTFAAKLLLSGVAIHHVSKLLGHSSVSITERNYLKYTRKLQEQTEAELMRTWQSDAWFAGSQPKDASGEPDPDPA